MRMLRWICVVLVLAMPALPALADDYDDGWAAIQNGDFDSAFTILKPLAEQGHIEAQFNLGVMYFRVMESLKMMRQRQTGFAKPPNRATRQPKLFSLGDMRPAKA